MRFGAVKAVATSVALAASTTAVLAHHPMGGATPATFGEGLLSGLGHPIIGLDHFAAVIAVGCLAALHRSGAASVLGYVLATIVGAAIHLRGIGLPGDELLVAISLLVLGALLVWRQPTYAFVTVTLFVLTGLVHGYVLGESIVGAEPAPLASYFLGLALIQSMVGVGALIAARRLVAPTQGRPLLLRVAGAAVAVVGAAVLVQQFASA